MHTFSIEVHYKVMEILPVSWIGAKLMQIFKVGQGNNLDLYTDFFLLIVMLEPYLPCIKPIFSQC